MNLIEKVIEELVPSKAIFKIDSYDEYGTPDKRGVSLSQDSEPYRGNKDTPINELVFDSYDEKFMQNKYKVDKQNILTSCKWKIKQTFQRLLVANMKQKHPRETKIGMFYHNQVFNHDVPALDSALISLYQYYMEKDDVENTMKLLEFLYIKHQEDFPAMPKPTRKRKRGRR